ncbi:YncE family protein [Lampropedia puyangensis]|uniref:YncE family protein n=1 Tax=Lampropedia puyangensis TaxID=1330072 RepID=A0A4S8FCM4_9BURK|nr:YncE family protein [Lampropedia puyangensis]THU05069.1 YncE family protein [Lampropedia puyangensis]
MKHLSTRSSATFKISALACTALLMVACQSTPTSSSAVAPATASQSLAAAPVLRQDSLDGIYEITTTRQGDSVFVASAGDFSPKSAGFIYRLDARTLEVVQAIQIPRRAFALGLNNATNTLYAGNTLDGSLSVVDANSGMVKGLIQLGEEKKNDKGEPYYDHTRKVVVDSTRNRVFVTSPGQPGKVWIVDGTTNTVAHTITSEGIWTAGAAFDEAANVLYVSQGGKDEILAIDPEAGQVLRRFSTGDSVSNQADDSKHFFVNLAIDTKGQRLFGADGNTNQIYVADIASGQFTQQIKVPGLGLLDVAYNPARNEIYASTRGVSREAPNGTGSVSVIDGTSFAIKRTIDLPVHPNTLSVSTNGKTLYVTVKNPHGDKHTAWRKDSKESVVRIDLQP